jgi:DNA-binding response OmpR family regulator
MNSCELQAAIVTNDANVMHAIALSLKKIGTASTVYHDKESALQAMHRTKVDALFVDREIDPELSLLNEMRAAQAIAELWDLRLFLASRRREERSGLRIF